MSKKRINDPNELDPIPSDPSEPVLPVEPPPEPGRLIERPTWAGPEPNGKQPRHQLLRREVCGGLLAERPTSIDLSTVRGKCLAFNATRESTILWDENATATLDVSDYIVVPEEGTNPETGELGEYLRFTLISPEGRTFSTTSPVVMHGWCRLVELFPTFWTGTPIRVVIGERRSRRTKQVYHQIWAVAPEESE